MNRKVKIIIMQLRMIADGLKLIQVEWMAVIVHDFLDQLEESLNE